MVKDGKTEAERLYWGWQALQKSHHLVKAIEPGEQSATFTAKWNLSCSSAIVLK